MNTSAPLTASLIAVACLSAGCAASDPPAHNAVRYSVTDLGTIEPFPSSKALGINNKGQVIGKVYSMGGGARGFIWNAGQMKGLSTNKQLVFGATAINDRGVIVGESLATDRMRCSFIWSGGHLDRLPSPAGAQECEATCVNSTGDIVGWFKADAGPPAQEAILWSKGKIVSLPRPSSGAALAMGINDAGVVVGWEQSRQRAPSRAVVWTHGKMAVLPCGGSVVGSGAFAINRKGEAAGYVLTSTGARHACLWIGGRLKDLGTLGGRDSEARAINSHGQIVGWAETERGGRRAFLYSESDGKMVDLNTMIPDVSRWLLRNALAINDRGQVVGSGMLLSADRSPEGVDDYTAFLLTPLSTGTST